MSKIILLRADEQMSGIIIVHPLQYCGNQPGTKKHPQLFTKALQSPIFLNPW